MKRKILLGLLTAAALASPLGLAYQYFDTHYLIISKADAMQLFQLLMMCMAGVPGS